ncbi:hypothetical protein HK104_008130, partial [Borealophlyctis nickersoniae]
MYVANLGIQIHFIIRSTAIILINTVTLSVFFIPKILAIRSARLLSPSDQDEGYTLTPVHHNIGRNEISTSIVGSKVQQGSDSSSVRFHPNAMQGVSGAGYMRQARWRWSVGLARWEKVRLYLLPGARLLGVVTFGVTGPSSRGATYNLDYLLLLDPLPHDD